MDKDLYEMIREFLKKYPLTIAFRLSKHIGIMKKHLNEDEEIIYLFTGQKNFSVTDIFSTCVIAFTNKRILVAQKRVLPGYRLTSITPDLFNDFQIFRGFIFGRIEIDTAKEVVQISNIDPKALVEIETNLSEYLLKIKPKFIKENK